LKSNCRKRIDDAVINHPSRWGKVLEIALLEKENTTDEITFLQSAFAVHTNYPPNLKVAEAILAGDAFIPMAIACLLDKKVKLSEIDTFLSEAVELFDITV